MSPFAKLQLASETRDIGIFFCNLRPSIRTISSQETTTSLCGREICHSQPSIIAATGTVDATSYRLQPPTNPRTTAAIKTMPFTTAIPIQIRRGSRKTVECRVYWKPHSGQACLSGSPRRLYEQTGQRDITAHTIPTPQFPIAPDYHKAAMALARPDTAPTIDFVAIAHVPPRHAIATFALLTFTLSQCRSSLMSL